MHEHIHNKFCIHKNKIYFTKKKGLTTHVNTHNKFWFYTKIKFSI